MNMQKRILNKIVYSSFFVFIFLFLSVATVHAQASKAITIIPPKFELFANPGDSVTERIRVRNDSDVPTTYAILIEDFTAAGEEGQVVLEEDAQANLNTTYSLAQWLEPESQELILQPNEERTFAFTINVPRDAEPGGHYASILFQTGGNEAVPGAAAVAQRIGTLVLLRVSGNVAENASITTFEAPTYSKSGPVMLTLRMVNEGNTHIRPKGTIVITNLFGKKVDEIPLEGANVLPGATRKMDTTWNKSNIMGYYTATLVATYGQQNLPLTAATRFTVLSPTMAALVIIAAVAGILFIISLISGKSRLLKALKVIATGK
jgi:hypothetical protein